MGAVYLVQNCWGNTSQDLSIVEPFTQDFGHSSAIVGTASGTQSVTLTWIGIGPAPSEVVIDVTQYAWVSYGVWLNSEQNDVYCGLTEGQSTSDNAVPNVPWQHSFQYSDGGKCLRVLRLTGNSATFSVFSRSRIDIDGSQATMVAKVSNLLITIDSRQIVAGVNGHTDNYSKHMAGYQTTWSGLYFRDAPAIKEMFDDNGTPRWTGRWYIPGTVEDPQIFPYDKAERVLRSNTYSSSLTYSKTMDIGLVVTPQQVTILNLTGDRYVYPCFCQEDLVYNANVFMNGISSTSARWNPELKTGAARFWYYTVSPDSDNWSNYDNYAATYWSPRLVTFGFSPLWNFGTSWTGYDPRNFPIMYLESGDDGLQEKAKFDITWQDGLKGKVELILNLHKALENEEKIGEFNDYNATQNNPHAGYQPFQFVKDSNVSSYGGNGSGRKWTTIGATHASAVSQPVNATWLICNKVATASTGALAGGTFVCPVLAPLSGFLCALFSYDASAPVGSNIEEIIFRQTSKGYFYVVAPWNWKFDYGCGQYDDDVIVLNKELDSSVVLNKFCWMAYFRQEYVVKVYTSDQYDKSGYVDQHVGPQNWPLTHAACAKYYIYKRDTESSDMISIPTNPINQPE